MVVEPQLWSALVVVFLQEQLEVLRKKAPVGIPLEDAVASQPVALDIRAQVAQGLQGSQFLLGFVQESALPLGFAQASQGLPLPLEFARGSQGLPSPLEFEHLPRWSLLLLEDCVGEVPANQYAKRSSVSAEVEGEDVPDDSHDQEDD